MEVLPRALPPIHAYRARAVPAASTPPTARLPAPASAADVSTGLLRWKGIEATEAIAESSNPKTVIIGSKGGGTPIILGNEAPTK